jgi:hypothetical protein
MSQVAIKLPCFQLGALTRPINYDNDSEVPITPFRELTQRVEGAINPTADAIGRPLRLKLFNYPPSHKELSMSRERFFGVMQARERQQRLRLGKD